MLLEEAKEDYQEVVWSCKLEATFSLLSASGAEKWIGRLNRVWFRR